VVPAPLLLLEAEQQPAVYRRGASSLLAPPCSSKQRAAPAWDGGCFSNGSWLTVAFAGGCAAGGVSVMSGVVTNVGAVSGPQGGYLVPVGLGEVVGHHQ
jgi:hypothetical protein